MWKIYMYYPIPKIRVLTYYYNFYESLSCKLVCVNSTDFELLRLIQ